MACALTFDGVNDYVDAGNGASLRITGSFTITAWINPSAFPGTDDNPVINKEDITPGCSYALNVTRDNGPEQFYVLVSNDGVCGPSAINAQRYSATTLSAGQWYHITGVYDAAAQTLHVYLNGVLNDGTLAGTVPAAINNTAGNVNIATRGSDTNLHFQGTIDDARVYNRALSAAEIWQLYTGVQ